MTQTRRKRNSTKKAAPPVRSRRSTPASQSASESKVEGAQPRCAACLSTAVTELSMTMTNGAHVDFMSCRDCEHKTWRSGGKTLSLRRVLAMAAKRK